MSAGHVLRRDLLALLAGSVFCLGCESAHYVLRGPDNGVVAIPVDTPEMRAKAEKLMHEQFPAGYVLDEVRVVAVGRPYHTVTRVGPFAEVERHQQHEVLMYYHAGQLAPAVPMAAPVVKIASPPSSAAAPPVQPASLTVPSGGLPPQPIPVN
jgi:hypothetical protein